MKSVQLPPRPEASGVQWLQQKRDEAWATFEANQPGRKDPRWLHTEPLQFIAPAPTAQHEPSQLGMARIVLVNGKYDASLSDDVEGVRIVPLDSDDEVARVHTNAAADDDVMAALNMAMWQGGVLIDAQPEVQATLHLVHVHTGGDASFDRVLVHAQDRSEVTIFQQFEGSGNVCAVTELHAHAGATINRDLFQGMTAGNCLHTTFTKADRDANINDVHVDFGADNSRNTTIGTAAGAGAHLSLGGLYLTAGKQRSDHWTRVDHAVPDTTSAEMYKGVLAGESRGSFTGNVLVRKDAQRTNAEQENRNLLLSRKALAESTPQLEIHADDVQCSHGSTVGQLDPKALFFLRSRGIGHDRARQMLTKAFAGEVVDMLSIPAVRDLVTARIEAWFDEASP